MFVYQVNQRKMNFSINSQLLTQLLVCGCLLLAVTEKSVLKSYTKWDFKRASKEI